MAKRAQNSGGSERKVLGRPFEKGKSGNPGGRPAGLMQAIRAETKDGKELAAFAFKVLRGEAIAKRKVSELGGLEVVVYPDTRERLEALKWLGDRGFGKAPLELDVSGGATVGVVILPALGDD